jgi:LacI family transcriptional regulator, galactose operon repressor
VINGNYPVSDDLQTRVQQAMSEVHYHPNALARGLRRQRTQSIGVLIPKLNDSHLSTFSYIVEKMLFANDYRALLCSTEEALERETAYIESLLQQRVDGVIMFPREYSRENVERLLQENIPVVLIERKLPDLPVHHIMVTNYEGGYMGMRHLIDLGHREIALFTAYSSRYPMRERNQGALDALRDAGIELPPEYFLTIDTDEPRFEIGYREGITLLKEKSRPTAIFAMIDEIAIGALHALSASGIKVPADMSLIGFDNIPLASVVFPPLTTVAQPTVQMAETAGAILLRTLEDHIENVELITLETKLVVRSSTAPPPRH